MSNKIGRDWQKKYPSTEDQTEFFLLKFSKHQDVSREMVMKLKIEFMTYDKGNKGELEVDEAMQLLEKRNETKTFKELKEMVQDIDLDQNGRLCFLEWACAYFKKSWVELHTPSVDPEELAKAEALEREAARKIAEKKAQEEKARKEADEKKLEELKAAQARAEAEGSKEAAELAKKALADEVKRQTEERERREAEEKRQRDEETSRKGVKGMAAKFKYAAQDTLDPTQKNASMIQEAARRRREARELEKREQQAREQAERAAKEAEEARQRAAEAEKKRLEAEADAREASLLQEEAEAAKRKALEGEEFEKKAKELYEQEKKRVAEEEASRKAEEARRREESRKRLAAKATLWSGDSSKGVIAEIGKGTQLEKVSVNERTGMDQLKLLGSIKKGVELKGTRAPSTDISESMRQAYLEDQKSKQ